MILPDRNSRVGASTAFPIFFLPLHSCIPALFHPFRADNYTAVTRQPFSLSYIKDVAGFLTIPAKIASYVSVAVRGNLNFALNINAYIPRVRIVQSRLYWTPPWDFRLCTRTCAPPPRAHYFTSRKEIDKTSNAILVSPPSNEKTHSGFAQVETVYGSCTAIQIKVARRKPPLPSPHPPPGPSIVELHLVPGCCT